MNNIIGDLMHTINIDSKTIQTDLILEQDLTCNNKINTKEKYEVINTKINNYHYTTIYFKDITDKDNYQTVQNLFITELKKYLKPKRKDIFLVVGLGNSKSTPDSLGPYTIDNILVTRYLYLMGDVEEGYSNVASFTPNVMGNTGIETSKIIKSIIKECNCTKVIIIDSLKTNHISRLLKTIQITDKGISPGSGIGNNRCEISKKTQGIEVIAIGVPTVVDIKTIIENETKEKQNITNNLILTPTNIDFIIEKLSTLIGNGINISLHENFIRQKN